MMLFADCADQKHQKKGMARSAAPLQQENAQHCSMFLPDIPF